MRTPSFDANRWNRLRYTVWAPIYDRVAGFGSQRRRAIQLLALRPGMTVLLVGAGTGADLPLLPANVRVTAVDLTPAMVARLRRRARELGRTIDSRVMDAHHLGFPDNSFDAVILHLILAVVPDPASAFTEAIRVFRPDGRAVIFDKFLAATAKPRLSRRVLNRITAFLFSDINRRLEPLLALAPVTVVHQEPAGFGGAYRIVLLRKAGE